MRGGGKRLVLVPTFHRSPKFLPSEPANALQLGGIESHFPGKCRGEASDHQSRWVRPGPSRYLIRRVASGITTAASPAFSTGGHSLQGLVATIAERRSSGVLALAQGQIALLRDLEGHRFEARAHMRSVAERLRRRVPAPAPPVRSSLQFQDRQNRTSPSRPTSF